MMAMCSYQTIARYDACSRRSRARKLDDVRSRERDNLIAARSFLRNLNMIKNRRTLNAECGYDLDDDECYYAPDSPSSGIDELDCIAYQGGSQMYHHSDTTSLVTNHLTAGCNYQQSSCDDFIGSQFPPSPAWSSSTSSADTHAITSDVTCLFELPESSRKSASPASSLSSGSQVDRQSSYKQRTKRASPRPKNLADPDIVKSKLMNLKSHLSNNELDAKSTSEIIHGNWLLILDCLRVYDKTIILETISLLVSLTGNNLINPETILHMLQNGLIYSLTDTITRTDEGALPILRLASNIASSAPTIIPYMIDLIHKSTLREIFADLIINGYCAEVTAVIEFYHYIIETTINQVYTGSHTTPLLPELVAGMGNKEALESYNPVSTLEKCLTPNLINNSVRKCSSNLNFDRLIHSTFLISYHALELINILSQSSEALPKHIEWIVKTLCSFRDAKTESLLDSMAKGLERKMYAAESSEHCSQGVGVETSAQTTLEECLNFKSFYQQYYGPLSSTFAPLMSQVEPTICSSSSNSLWSL